MRIPDRLVIAYLENVVQELMVTLDLLFLFNYAHLGDAWSMQIIEKG